MDTSLAEDLQHTATTLQSRQLFSLCRPIAVLPRQAVLPVFLNPPSAVTIRRALSAEISSGFPECEKNSGIAHPVMVGAIPFDTRKPSSLFIPQRWQTFSPGASAVRTLRAGRRR